MPDRDLFAGLVEDTRETSHAAAVSVGESKETLRARVYEAILHAGRTGLTDDELQVLLQMDGSTERPRRWELWKADRIRIQRDRTGTAIMRETRTRRRAVVWVATSCQMGS